MPDKPVHENDVQRLGARLHELMGVINQRTTGETLELMHEQQLTLPMMVALYQLQFSGPTPLSTLGQCLRLSSSAASSMVDRLVERGLVSRREDPEDRRQKLIGVTATGTELVGRMAAARAREMEVAFSGVPPELRTRLIQVFEEVIAQLRAGESS